MQVTETANEGLSREYAITISATDLESKLDAQLLEIKATVNLKGFRPGKAPMAHLKKMYGKQLLGEVIDKTIRETSAELLEEKKLVPAMQPAIEIINYEENGDLEYKVTLEVMPDIPEQDFSKIKLTNLMINEKDAQAELDSALKRLAEGNRSFAPRKDSEKSEDGDKVLINFAGKIDGVAFEGGTAEDYSLVLGSGSFIPGFEAQLVGKKNGDDLEVKVTFPEDYNSAELAGKDAVFDVTINEISAPGDPVIDDTMASQFGMENLDQLKEALKGQVEGDFNAQSRMRLKRSLLDELDGLYDFDLPPKMLESEALQVAKHLNEEGHDHDHDHDHGEGHDHDHDHDHDDKDEDVEVNDEHREIAARRVRLGLVLAELGRSNNIEVSEDELNRHITNEARRYPGQEQQFMDYIKNNPETINQFRAPLFEDKVVDYVLELAMVSDKAVSKDELLAEPDDEGEKKPAKKVAKTKAKPAAKKTAKKKKD